MTWFLLLVPFAAGRAAYLLGQDTVTAPLRDKLRARMVRRDRVGKAARWVLSGWECGSCASLQTGLLFTAGVVLGDGNALGVVTRVAVVALIAGMVGTVALNVWVYANRLLKYRIDGVNEIIARDATGGTLLRAIWVNGTGDTVVVEPASVTDSLALAKARRAEYVTHGTGAGSPPDGFHPMKPFSFDDLMGSDEF